MVKVRPLLALLALVLATLAGDARAAEHEPFIRLSVADGAVFLGDTIVVQIEYSGLDETLDASPLEAVGRLGRRTIGTHIAVIGGRVVDIRSLRIEITPTRLGRIAIGPLASGAVTSNTIVLEVAEERVIDWLPGAEDIEVEATLKPAGPVVHEQLTYDLVLKHRHPLSRERIQLPKFEGFDVVPVFEERRTLNSEDGWRQIAWRYFLFPVRSGQVTIEPARFTGVITKSRLEQNSYDIAAQSLDVKVGPAEPASSWWLPARSVIMRDEWSADPRTLSAGDEIERTIFVSAQNVMARQIPQIVMPETRGLRVTPLGAERSMRVTEHGVLGETSFRFRIRAMSPVPVFLDTIRLAWWNTATRTAQESIIPARRIDIGAPDLDKLTAEARQAQPLADRLADRLPGGLNATLAGFIAVALCLLLADGTKFGALAGWIGAWRTKRRAMRLARSARWPQVAALLRGNLDHFTNPNQAMRIVGSLEESVYGLIREPTPRMMLEDLQRLRIRATRAVPQRALTLPEL